MTPQTSGRHWNYPVPPIQLRHRLPGRWGACAAAGALAAGPLTDRFGRKILLITDAAIYAAGSILSAVTVDAGMLLASRTLIGLAIGADSAIATAYIAEFAPRARRGQLSIIQQWMITVGILVAYIVAVIILKAAPGSASGADWRLILGLGGVPALVAVALRSHLPESPRWLMLHGRYDETRRSWQSWGRAAGDDAVAASSPCRELTVLRRPGSALRRRCVRHHDRHRVGVRGYGDRAGSVVDRAR